MTDGEIIKKGKALARYTKDKTYEELLVAAMMLAKQDGIDYTAVERRFKELKQQILIQELGFETK